MDADESAKGGGVDKHFVESYHAATAAGISVDAYLFPCKTRVPICITLLMLWKVLEHILVEWLASP